MLDTAGSSHLQHHPEGQSWAPQKRSSCIGENTFKGKDSGQWGEGKIVGNMRVNTKSREGEGGGSPGAEAEIPLQPLERSTHWSREKERGRSCSTEKLLCPDHTSATPDTVPGATRAVRNQEWSWAGERGEERCWFNVCLCFLLYGSILMGNKLNSFSPNQVWFVCNNNW